MRYGLWGLIFEFAEFNSHGIASVDLADCFPNQSNDHLLRDILDIRIVNILTKNNLIFFRFFGVQVNLVYLWFWGDVEAMSRSHLILSYVLQLWKAVRWGDRSSALIYWNFMKDLIL